jgi:hypothetical protein
VDDAINEPNLPLSPNSRDYAARLDAILWPPLPDGADMAITLKIGEAVAFDPRVHSLKINCESGRRETRDPTSKE